MNRKWPLQSAGDFPRSSYNFPRSIALRCGPIQMRQSQFSPPPPPLSSIPPSLWPQIALASNTHLLVLTVSALVRAST